jgi:23S rRNA (uracil1939-C5)-methyltransferase
VGEGVTVDIGPTDFFQTNPAVGRQIWAELPEPQHAVVDLYAGVGAVAFALWARAKAKGESLRMLGVEANASAVGHARSTAERLGADARFIAGEAGSALPEGYEGATVVLNPPRKGTTEAVRIQTAALRPERIVYISCHPEPLARDLAEWQQRGWKVTSVRTYDMFPGTPHVETVAVLEAV